MKAMIGSIDDRYFSTTAPSVNVWECEYPMDVPASPAVCPICGGTGAMPQHIKDARHAAGLSPHIVEILCAGCAGTGVLK